MGRLRRKRMHKDTKDIRKKYRLRRKTKDLDQIHEDFKPENIEAAVNQPVDGDLPGLGQFYCLHCTVKNLSEVPYTVEEAHAAAGMGSYRLPKPAAVPDMEELHAKRAVAAAEAAAVETEKAE